MNEIVVSRRLLGSPVGQTHLLDYLNWSEGDRTRFRAYFAKGTDPASIDAAPGMDLTVTRSIGEGLLVDGYDDEGRVPIPPFARVTPSESESALFAGMNTLLATRNGESADIVVDWLEYHVTHHGAHAALILNRGQDSEDLARVLCARCSQIPTLRRVLILSSPIPLGHKNLPPEAHPFCAPAAPGKDRMRLPEPDPWSSPLAELLFFEIARTRFLQQARAVAAIDVYDVLLPAEGPSVFDLACSADSGAVSLVGTPSYPWRVRKNHAPHFSDHICTQFDGTKFKRRWCIAPAVADPDVIWRLVRIVGAEMNPDHIGHFAACMNLRHPSNTVSQIVPKTALAEDDRLLQMSRAYFDGNPVRMPEAKIAQVGGNDDRSIVVVTCMKNEGPFILEWLAYHRMIGIKNFLIYTNDCDDGTDTLLNLLQDKGYVQHRNNPFRQVGLKPQHAALQAADNEPIVKKSAWAVSMDVDEFICIHVGDGTLSALFDAVPNANMISMTWRLFGNSGIDHFSDALVTNQYTRCARVFANKPHQAWGFKTLYRQNGIFRKLGVHRPKGLRPQLKDQIQWVNGSGAEMPQDTFRNAWRSTSRTYGYDLVTLNHYAVRSSESFLVKRERGRVNHVDRDQGLAYWFRMNNNEAEDTSILRMMDPLDAELAELMRDPEIAAQHAACVAAHSSKIDTLKSSASFAAFYNEITSERMRRLSTMHRHFGANVFLGGPQTIPDQIVFEEHDHDFFFTIRRQETSH